MPELPDVELYKRHLDATSLRRPVARVDVRNAKILGKVSARELTARVAGRRFEGSRRHGKHLLVRLDDSSWLTLHFGMTGRLQHFRDPADDPPHDRLCFDFADGSHLAYVDVRMLGRVGVAEDADRFIAEAGLGPDILDPAFDFAAFEAALAGRRGDLKALLMNQEAMAGIGNIYSDEILFQGGVHPKTKAGDLEPVERKRLFRAIRKVLETAIARGAGSEDFLDRLPGSYLLPHRRTDGICPRCRTSLAYLKFGGRRAFYCPRCQPPP